MINFRKSIRSFLKDKFKLESDNLELFAAAFTHSSYKVHDAEAKDYEQLELLGDSVLSLVITERLYKKNLELKDICNFRKEVVSGASLSWATDKFDLYKYIRIGKGCPLTSSIKEDVYEAFIGAIYLTFGYPAASRVVRETLYDHYISKNMDHFVDYKTQLQEFVQSEHKGKKFFYTIEKTETLSDGRKVFLVSANLGNQKIATAEGFRLKSAEQEAAKAALIKFKRLRD